MHPIEKRIYMHRAGETEIPVRECIYTRRTFELRLLEATRDYIFHAMRSQGTPGLNLAIGYREHLIWEAGFGHADLWTQRPMTPQTVFHSGSLGKTYTATAVMQLVDRGTVQLDDPIDRYLSFEIRNPLGDRAVTVRDLMTHRSGLSGDSAESRFRIPRSLAEEVREQYARDPGARKYGKRWASKVGERFAYSNLGLATLGLLVESANTEGLQFGTYVQKHVMDPLGMTASQYPLVQDERCVRPDIWEQMSTGYSRMGSVWIPTLPVYFANYPAGGVLGKPSDHLRLLLAMLGGGNYRGHQLLKADTLSTMLTPANDELITENARQGLIWRVANSGKANEKFYHAGAHMYGWTTQGVAWPRYGLALMAASNQWSLPDKSTDVFMIEDFIENWMLRQPSDVELAAPSREWTRKVSYVRGVLFAFSFKTHCGIPEEIPEQALARSMAGARLQPGSRQDWDEDSFRRGIDAVKGTDCSYAAIHRLLRENTVVTVEELRTIYQELGGRLDATSYSIGLLPELDVLRSAQHDEQ